MQKLKESIVEFNDNNNSDNRFEIFTEFGRSMIQKCGWIGTYVNNVKITVEEILHMPCW